MAISDTQRSNALDVILRNYTNDQTLGQLLPGLTGPQVLTTLLNALGTTVDGPLTQVCGALVAAAQTDVVRLQNQVIALQSKEVSLTVV